MKTGSHLKIKSMGDAVLGVKLEGNPSKPEPIHFRVVLPFGVVDIVRCTGNDYWVHVITNRPNDGHDPDRQFGKFTDARIDIISKHASETNAGDFKHPDTYHMAVRVTPDN